jgi:hypothetical protein
MTDSKIPDDKFYCPECDTIMNKSSKSAHLKTQKHKRNAGEIKENIVYKNDENVRQTLRKRFKLTDTRRRLLVGDDAVKNLAKLKKRFQRKPTEENKLAYEQAKVDIQHAKTSKVKDLNKEIFALEPKEIKSKQTTNRVRKEVINKLIHEKKTLTGERFTREAICVVDRVTEFRKGCLKVKSQSYEAHFRGLYKKLFEKDWDCKDFEFLKDYGNVIAFIREVPNIHTKDGYLKSIVYGYFPHLPQEYKEYYPIYKEEYDTVNIERNKQLDEGIINPSKVKNILPWLTIKQGVKKNIDKLRPIEKMAVLLYTSIPPRRNEAYQSMRISTNKNISGKNTNHNWLITTKEMFPIGVYFGKYKTKETLGSQYFEFSKDYKVLSSKIPMFGKNSIKNFQNQLKNILNEFNYENGDYLFKDVNSWSGFIKNAMRKILDNPDLNIGSTMLRHSWSSYVYGLKPRLNIKELNIVSGMAGHSRKLMEIYSQGELLKKEEERKQPTSSRKKKKKKKKKKKN